MRIKGFSQFIKESEDLENLTRLRDLGLIDQAKYKRDSRELALSAMSAAIDRGDSPTSVIPTIKATLESPEADLLRARGLEVVSSKNQLLNGTLIWSRPGYERATGWGLGFFPDVRLIRRMTPKGIKLNWVRPLGSMDILIKDFSRQNIPTDLEFYKIAMKWANDHIDWERLEAEYATEDPSVWRYYVKNKTKSGYFEN